MTDRAGAAAADLVAILLDRRLQHVVDAVHVALDELQLERARDERRQRAEQAGRERVHREHLAERHLAAHHAARADRQDQHRAERGDRAADPSVYACARARRILMLSSSV